jgi:hypothetical protein
VKKGKWPYLPIIVLLGVLLIFVSPFAYLAVSNYLDDRNLKVEILQNTPLYEDSKVGHFKPSIGAVAPGEKLTVLGTSGGKDYLSIEIRRADGTTGWITLDSEIRIYK